MSAKIIPISDRGQITIPNNFRELFTAKYVICRLENHKIILEPIQTKDDFFEELENEEKDWEQSGGVPFDEVMMNSAQKE